MALKDLSDEELLDDIRSMEDALRQYNAEVKRRVLELDEQEWLEGGMKEGPSR